MVGEVEIGGAKNAALAILSAAVMTDETVTIENLPNVRDINVLLNAIQVKKGQAYTIVEIKNGWGKTKDGWIKLSYTKKC